VTRPRNDPGGRSWGPAADADAASWRETRWRPASLLEGDRDGEYELEYRVASPGDTPDTGWYLYGGGIFGRYMDRRLDEALAEADRWISGSAYGSDASQDSLDQDSLGGAGAVVVALPVRSEGDMPSEEELVRELRAAHADQECLDAELAAARQRRREAAAGLRSLGRSMNWIAGQIGVTQQAVDGFLKYKERHRENCALDTNGRGQYI
jgi:hypothetical protein